MNDLGARFRLEQREREAFLRNARESSRATTVTRQIEDAIADAGGSTRDALNNALAGRDAAVTLLQAEGGKVIALMVALEEIREIAGFSSRIHSRWEIARIARDALCVAGSIPITTEED